MSEKSMICEITKMMQDQTAIQQDMTEAMDLVRNMFQEKYMSRIHKAVRNHQLKVQSNPPREVQLLKTMKLFMPEEKHASLDGMLDMMLMMSAAEGIQKELAATSITTADPNVDDSVHEDGVYDIDSACLTKKQSPAGNMAGLFMMASLMGMM